MITELSQPPAAGPLVLAREDALPSDVLVAIPAYNEERFIGSLVIQIRLLGFDALVIDDGSTDQTAAIARNAGATVEQHPVNKGKAEALNTAFRWARASNYQALIAIDGDAQHDPAEIAQLVPPIRDGKADLVIGSRFLDTSAGRIPALRSLGQRSMTIATNLSSGTAVSDSQSGFRAFSRRAIDALVFHSQGFGVEGEMQFQIRDYQLKVMEVAITARYPDAPKRNVVQHGLHVLNCTLRLVERHRPLLFFSVPGMLLLALGLAFGALTTTIYQQTQVLAVGYALITVLGVLAGLLALFTGLTLHAVRGVFLDLERRIILGPNRLASHPPTSVARTSDP